MFSSAMVPYLLTLALLGIGIYAISTKKNLIKVIVGILVTEYAVNLFILLQGYRAGGGAPILAQGQEVGEFARTSVDPLPQALILTSIVIGLGTVALLVALALRIHEKYGTFDLSRIRRLRG